MTRWLMVTLAAAVIWAQAPDLVRVIEKPVEGSLRLTGEFAPFDSVDLRARVPGYVERVLVDRGTMVGKDQVIAELAAPEMAAQLSEAEARQKSADALKSEAAARLESAESVLARLRAAAATAGAISGLELVEAEKKVDAAKAAVSAAAQSAEASRAAVASLRQMESYLKVRAPFAGVVTERLMSPGALAGPATGPLVRIDSSARLRLIVAVPESEAGNIHPGTHVPFTVPAYPGQSFTGAVARVAHSMDAKSRTMPVEVEVANPGLKLAPGMYPEVKWPVRRSAASLMVPATSVVTTTERTFVIRDKDGRAEWVDVKKGSTAGELVAIMGPVKSGDSVVKRATDEIRPGAKLR